MLYKPENKLQRSCLRFEESQLCVRIKAISSLLVAQRMFTTQIYHIILT